MLRLHQPLVEEGRAILADGDETAGQRLVHVVKTDESGEFLLHLFQPVMDGLLLFQQAVRLFLLKGLLDDAPVRSSSCDLRSSNSAGAPISRG